MSKRTNSISKPISIALAAIMLFSAAGCGSDTEPSPDPAPQDDPAVSADVEERTDSTPETSENIEYKDTITVATFEDPFTMDPMENNRTGNSVVTANIFEGLWYLEEDGSVSPRLATDWEFLDDTTILFNLRKDVKFHDGSPFTAEDVLFSYDRASKNPVSITNFQHFDIPNCKVIDDYTFELKLTQAFAPIFDALGSNNPRSGIVCKAAVERMGDAEYARNPVATGPYKFVEWNAGSDITITRFDEYWGEPALTENIVFKIIPEASGRVIELETGGVDLANSIAGSDVERVEALPGITTIVGKSTRNVVLLFSMQHPLLQSLDFRKGLGDAIDKEAICNLVYGGTATPADGMMSNAAWGYFPAQEGVVEYNVERAMEYIEKSGYSGEIIDILVEPTEEFNRCAEMVQNMFAAVGVNTNVVSMATAAYGAQNDGMFPISIRAQTNSEISQIFTMYDSSRVGERAMGNDDKLDQMLAEAMTYYDDEKRFEAYKEMQEYLLEMRRSIPIAYTATIYAMTDKFEGFQFDPNNRVNLSTARVAK